MEIIVGNDISHFQGAIDWNTYANNTNFVIIEVTEGTGFVDPLFTLNQAQARQHNIPIAYYHFTRPDLGNTPQSEADFFLANIGQLREGEVLALDFEVNFNAPVAWLKDMLDYIVSKTGVHALIYLNKSEVGGFDWTLIVEAGYGLWEADYNDAPVLGEWKLMALKQWTNKQTVPGIPNAVDGDYFYGTADQFRMYGYHVTNVPPVNKPPSLSASLSPSSSVSSSKSPSSSVSSSISPSSSISASPSPSEEIITQELFDSLVTVIDDQWNWFGAKAWYTQLAKLRKILNG